MMNKHFSLFTLLICLVAGLSGVHAQDTQAKGSDIQIVDARLGTGVQDRMIVGEDSSFAPNSKVFLWMKVIGGATRQITVIWKSGEYSRTATLTISGSPWRTWASKNVYTAADWAVTVTDTSGNVLKEMMFKVR